MEKDFSAWHRFKSALQQRQNSPNPHERDIWWCSIGVNIGHEEDGKGTQFSRPVLVIHKFNRRIFWGVPLTTQIKDKLHYHRIHFKEREQCVMLSQLRLWETRRLTHKMGKLPDDQFEAIRAALRKLL